MQSKATTVEQYLSEMPEDRRAAIATVRHVILKNLDKDYEEGMQYGMIGYYVPHRIYPAGYHTNPKQPLPYVCLASQKDYMSLYMMPVYGEGIEESWFRDEWAKTGKKLDMGKSCIRFKHLEDLALNVIGEAIRRTPVSRHIEYYESVIKNSRKKTSKQTPAKPAGKQASNGKQASKATSNAKAKSASAKPSATKPAKRKLAAVKSTAGKTAQKSRKVAAKKPAKKSAAKSVAKVIKKKTTSKKKTTKR
ncbi:MAG: DUF1801 domain-containing protein [Planctomycetota bacterium]